MVTLQSILNDEETREISTFLDLTRPKVTLTMWRFPEFLLFSALVVSLGEHLMVVFCYRPYFFMGVVLYKQTFLASNVSIAFPTADCLKDDLEDVRRRLIVRNLGGGLFAINASYGYRLIPVFDLLNATLRFEPSSKTVILTGRCYWTHSIMLFLGVVVAVQFQNPIIFVVLCVGCFVRYFFHRRTYSIIGEAAVRAWSADS